MQYYIEKNKLLTFSYNGVSSSTFSLYVIDVEGLYNSFERDIEFVEVKGRDGDIILDNKRRKSKDITVNAFIDIEESYIDNISDIAMEIEKWLQGEIGYKELIFSDDKKNLQAICINQIKISETIENLGEVEIKFKIKP